MAMHLITGHSGTAHISAADDGALNAAIVGDGSYVFDFGDDFAATMTTANSVTIGTGALVHQGRKAWCSTSTQLTVQSGSQAQKRRDLVVARYTKSGDVEDMQLAVIRGTPVSYGEPSDPAHEDGSVIDGATVSDFPLWRIPIDGITPGTPVRLFDVTPSLAALRDSVSRTGPVTVASGQWGEVTAWSVGGVVTVAARWTSGSASWQDETVGTLPAGMRPPRSLFAPFARDNITQAYGDVCLNVRADGGVAISGRGGPGHQGDQMQTSLTFVAAG